MGYLTYIALGLGLLAVFLLWATGSSLLAIILVGALIYLAVQSERGRLQLGELHRLKSAYEQLDQQAKLILRTDLELHRTQEELDRRLASLMSLYDLGRQLQVSLQPDEVFGKLDATIVTHFGFSKGLLGLSSSFDAVEWRSLVGVSPPDAERLRTHFLQNGLLKYFLSNPTPHTVQLNTATNPHHQKLLELLGVPTVVVSGVIPHTGPAGLLVFGRAGGIATNPKADEELVAILTNQLVSAVENSALYEAAWRSTQELERKVQERTRELAEANAGLVRLNKAKSDFVSAVAHELRTPLAAIKGYAALLGGGQFGPVATPQRERIGRIEKHADLLAQLINNLLDIARIESGRVTMERHPIVVDEFLTTVHEVVAPQLDAKRLRYTADGDGVKQLTGDPQHLQRVFVNLLSNAIKYTPEEGSIRVTLTREGDLVVATVSDTGCGIAPEDLPKLFQEFYRAHDPVNQQVPGTGLGLALAKRIVEAHQGTIAVASERGKGTTFTISLPAG